MDALPGNFQIVGRIQQYANIVTVLLLNVLSQVLTKFSPCYGTVRTSIHNEVEVFFISKLEKGNILRELTSKQT